MGLPIFLDRVFEIENGQRKLKIRRHERAINILYPTQYMPWIAPPDGFIRIYDIQECVICFADNTGILSV